VGLAVYVGAHVEQHAGIPGCAGHRRCQGRPIHPRQSAQHHLGCSHRGAGIARA